MRQRVAQFSGRGGLIAASLFAATATGCGSTEAPAPNPDPIVTPDEPPQDPAYGAPPEGPEWNEAPDEPAVDIYGAPPGEPEDESAEINSGEVDTEAPVSGPAYGIPPAAPE